MNTGADYLSRSKLAWLLVAQAFIVVPQLFFLPSWLLAVWGLAVFWRIQMFLGRYKAPNNWLKGLLIIACGAGILLSFGGRLVTEAMVSLLLCTFVLKLLEVKAQRDARWMIMIGFICSATQLLFSQSPFAALYVLVCCWLLLACWRALQLPRPQAIREGLTQGALLLTHALPVMLVLFVFLPRLGPLWAIPNQQSASTGFSDSLSPGDLGQLAQNMATAFRVEFQGTAPATNQLYWRGLVLDQFDGRRWRLHNPWTPQAPAPSPNASTLLHYHIIIEPHGLPWLFALPTAVQLSSGAQASWINSERLLMTRQPLQQRMAYQVASDLHYREAQPQLSPLARQQLLQLPDGFNPRAQALAASWVAAKLSAAQIQQQALALFSREFSYTLRPPTLGEHSVDEFLFDSKRGFCEHFASSFTVLMRAAGIPARVAVGYQGGQWNPVENYLNVRQADAHAWVEVWSDELGWQRVDPTAAVAPNRIEQGLNDALSSDEQQLLAPTLQFNLLGQLQLRWDAATYLWQRWVLSYDEQMRASLLDRWLGHSGPLQLLGLVLGLLLALVLTIVLWLWWQRPRVHWRAEVKLMRRLERKLAARGFTRTKGETPSQFLQRVGAAQPAHSNALATIDALYCQVAYCEQNESLAALKKAIARI